MCNSNQTVKILLGLNYELLPSVLFCSLPVDSIPKRLNVQLKLYINTRIFFRHFCFYLIVIVRKETEKWEKREERYYMQRFPLGLEPGTLRLCGTHYKAPNIRMFVVWPAAGFAPPGWVWLPVTVLPPERPCDASGQPCNMTWHQRWWHKHRSQCWPAALK